MSEWEKVDGTDEDYGIMPLDSETGLPDNHVVTIIERRITVDFPTLIQNNVKTDTITLDLDAEWDDVDAYLIFGWTGGTKMVEYTAPATVIPRECMEDVGTVSLSVVGYNKDRTMRLVTVYAPGIFTVIQSGMTIGDTVAEAAPDLLAQLLAAAEAADKAVLSANAAVESATTAVTNVNKAIEDAGTATESANNAAAAASTATERVNATYVKSASATTLNPGSSATATIESNVLKIGVPKGEKGDAGTAATIQVGAVTTLDAGENATVTNAGTTSTAKLNFGIPKGDKGDTGTAATITVGDVTRLEAGDDPTVENSGTTGAAVLDFGIPVYDNIPVGEATGTNVSLTDCYGRKPMGIVIKPKMVENLWVNPRGTTYGVTVTPNADGSVTISGANTASATIVSSPLYTIKPGTKYVIFVDKVIAESTGQDISFALAYKGAQPATPNVHFGYPGMLSRIFTTPSSFDYCQCVFFFSSNVAAGTSFSGTYRVTLVEGSHANMYVNDSVSLKIGSTSIPINLNGNKLCSLLNGPQDEIQITPTGAVKLIKRVDEDTTTALESPQEITLPSVTLPALDAPVATISVVTDLPSEVTVTYERDINLALKQAEEIVAYNDSTGTYSRQGITNMINRQKDGLVYGYRQYKDIDTQLDKLGANLGMPVPIPGTPTTPPDDPYLTKGGPFFWREVNGKVDAEGNLDVTAFMEDAKFSRTDPDGDVATLTPTLYEKWVETEDYIDHYICDSPLSGFTIQPGGKDPNGDPRPFMLHAKYLASKDASGKVRSVSGAKPMLRGVSHNSLIDLCDNATTGYSAYNSADDWYIKTMYALKYASKNSQSKFPGATGYYVQYKATVAESNTNRVIISKANANNLLVGSSCSLGTNPTGVTSLDRGTSTTYDIFDIERITRIEEYDSNNSAVYFEDLEETFTTTINSLLSTMPWWTGSCDDIVGDGQVAADSKHPFVLQGIELGYGCYEVMGNVIIKNDGSTGWKVYVNHDSKNEKTTYSADFYEDTGLILPTNTSDGWKYPTYYKSFKGILSSDNTGGSTTTGMCDGIYTDKLSTVGERQWLSFGDLHYGSVAGLWFGTAGSALSSAGWNFGSRLSLVGRSQG